MNIRLATNADGPTLGAFAKAGGWGIDLDWSKVAPFWLVAENEGRVVAGIEVCPGLPVGRLEFLVTDPDLDGIARARAVHGLLTQGMATLKEMGSQFLSTLVGHDLKAYRKILKKRGAVTVDSGAIMVKRL